MNSGSSKSDGGKGVGVINELLAVSGEIRAEQSSLSRTQQREELTQVRPLLPHALQHRDLWLGLCHSPFRHNELGALCKTERVMSYILFNP